MANRPTLRQLEYVVAVADERNFHRAADVSFVTQPALSTQILQLESQLELRLFERDRRKVLFTAAGEDFVVRARAILAAVDEMVEAAHAFQSPLSGTLRMGVIPTIAPYLLPQAMGAVRERHAKLRLLVREGQTSELVRLVLGGKLDLALLAIEADLESLQSTPLFSDPFVLAMPAGHPLARRRLVSEQDLAGEEVLLLEEGHCLRDQAWTLCDRAGATEAGDFRATSLGTLVQMVAGGIGLTLLPTMATSVELGFTGDIVTRSFRKPAPCRTIGLAWRPTSARKAEFEMLGETLRGAREPHAG
jgi:LysR family hydrogen peroxide-inducible transcriptional activator